MRKRLKTNWQDLWGLILWPGIIALLPVKLGQRVAWGISSLPLYQAQVNAAWKEFCKTGIGVDQKTFYQRRRYYILMDHADLWWYVLRGDAWDDLNVKVIGSWPQGTSLLATGFHWGNGLWVMRHLVQAGLETSFLAKPIDADLAQSHRVRRWYMRQRIKAIEAVSKTPIIFLGGAANQLRSILSSSNKAIVGLIDMPPTETHSLVSVKMWGKTSRMPSGMVRIAQALKVPIVLFSLGYDDKTQQRCLWIKPMIDTCQEMPTEVIMQTIADYLQEKLTEDPAGWHFWDWLPAYFMAEDLPLVQNNFNPL